MATFATEMGVTLVYAGDNDAAGDKLREALDEVAPYRVKQPPKPYKDWGDFMVGAGPDAVMDYCFEEIDPKNYPPKELKPDNWNEMTDVEKVQHVIPGSVELKIKYSPDSSKERTGEPQPLF